MNSHDLTGRFPVMQHYEREPWYDQNGAAFVFLPAKGRLTGSVGFSHRNG